MATARKTSRSRKAAPGKKRRKTKSSLSGTNSIVGKIARHAKKIRKPGEKWTNAIKRASKEI